jgi:RNA polymerase sigma-70 factor (ECF subfamily)
VVALLSGRPRQQRATAALFYVEQATVAEIAVALALSEGAVKFHLHKAREALRAVLQGEAPDPAARHDDGGPR